MLLVLHGLSDYHTVKNFGSQKVWQKGLLKGIGEKSFGKF